MDVLSIDYCVTNYPKTNGLKHVLSHIFCVLGMWVWFIWVLWLRVSYKVAVEMSSRAAVISELSWEKGFVPSLFTWSFEGLGFLLLLTSSFP